MRVHFLRTIAKDDHHHRGVLSFLDSPLMQASSMTIHIMQVSCIQMSLSLAVLKCCTISDTLPGRQVRVSINAAQWRWWLQIGESDGERLRETEDWREASPTCPPLAQSEYWMLSISERLKTR